MGQLIVNQAKVNKDNAEKIIKLCPFGAISYANGKIDISQACKMCKMCAKKSDGIIEYIEDIKQTVDKELWKGICVFVDCSKNKIHRVTYELCGKAKELSCVTGHPVYALYIGDKPGKEIENLLYLNK